MENEVEKKRERKLLGHDYRLREITNPLNMVSVSQESQKKKSKKERQGVGGGWGGVYLNELYLRTSLTWGRKQAFKSKRHREFSKSTRTGQH